MPKLFTLEVASQNCCNRARRSLIADDCHRLRLVVNHDLLTAVNQFVFPAIDKPLHIVLYCD